MSENAPVYGIVGRGRLARHLCHYLALEGLSVKQWHRGLGVAPEQGLQAADVIIVALKDEAIPDWIAHYLVGDTRPVIHCSGALSLVGVQGFHPLYTFSDELYSLATYRAIPFVCEQGRYQFADLFPTLANPYYHIASADKSLYHALCVVMGNLATILWQRGLDLATNKLQVQPQLFAPFLRQTLENTLNNPRGALTGPIQREDWQTIQQHLEALEGQRLQDIYRCFLTTYTDQSW